MTGQKNNTSCKIGKHIIKESMKSFMLWYLMGNECHGYGIISMINNSGYQNTGHKITPSRIYPVLHKLKKEGLIKSRKVKQSGRDVILYKTTTKGINVLKQFKGQIPEFRLKFMEYLLSK